MVKDELAAQNRDPKTFRFGKRVNVHVEEGLPERSTTRSDITTVAESGQTTCLPEPPRSASQVSVRLRTPAPT